MRHPRQAVQRTAFEVDGTTTVRLASLAMPAWRATQPGKGERSASRKFLDAIQGCQWTRILYQV